jgi:hypothetical protein
MMRQDDRMTSRRSRIHDGAARHDGPPGHGVMAAAQQRRHPVIDQQGSLA